MKRRLLLAAAPVLSLGEAAADVPLIQAPRSFDAYAIVGQSLQPGAATVRSLEFQPSRDGGPLWTMLDIVALREGGGDDDEMVFELSLLDVPMQVADSVLIVKGSAMVKPDGASWPRDDQGRLASPSRRPLPGPEHDALANGLAAGRVRRLVVIREFDIRRPAPTRFGVGARRLQGLRPLRVELQLGQGPVPRELRAYANRVNGAWLKRHVGEAALIGSGVLLGALAIWRLRR